MEKIKKEQEKKPAVTEMNEIDFGTFSVADDGEMKPSYLLKQMEKKGPGKKKKLVKSLRKAEAEKALLEELKSKKSSFLILNKSLD